MNDIQISVIITVYNTEKYLCKCIDSILNQTYTNFELIIVNDGSPDNSLSIIQNYKDKDNRIKVISRENKGLLYSRVEGVKKAVGQYVLFVDSDDWIEKNMLEVFMKKIGDSDIIRCNYNYILEEKNEIRKQEDFKRDEIIYDNEINTKVFKEFNISNKFNNVWRQLIKKDLIDVNKIDTTIVMGEDLEFNLNTYKNVKKITLINDFLYNYRYNNESITKQLDYNRLSNNIIENLKLYNNLIKFMKIYSTEKNVELAYNRFIEKVNFVMYRLIKYTYESEKENKFKNIYLVFNSDLMKDTRCNIKFNNIIINKKIFLHFFIFNNNMKLYIKTLRIISLFGRVL